MDFNHLTKHQKIVFFIGISCFVIFLFLIMSLITFKVTNIKVDDIILIFIWIGIGLSIITPTLSVFVFYKKIKKEQAKLFLEEYHYEIGKIDINTTNRFLVKIPNKLDMLYFEFKENYASIIGPQNNKIDIKYEDLKFTAHIIRNLEGTSFPIPTLLVAIDAQKHFPSKVQEKIELEIALTNEVYENIIRRGLVLNNAERLKQIEVHPHLKKSKEKITIHHKQHVQKTLNLGLYCLLGCLIIFAFSIKFNFNVNFCNIPLGFFIIYFALNYKKLIVLKLTFYDRYLKVNSSIFDMSEFYALKKTIYYYHQYSQVSLTLCCGYDEVIVPYNNRNIKIIKKYFPNLYENITKDMVDISEFME